MDDIKIVRLYDTCDIICRCVFNSKNNTYELHEPMLFDISHRGQLLLQHWLPLGVIENNCAIIREKDILCFLVPNSNLIEYYTDTMDKINKMVSNKEEDNQITGELLQAMEELNSKEVPIH